MKKSWQTQLREDMGADWTQGREREIGQALAQARMDLARAKRGISYVAEEGAA